MKYFVYMHTNKINGKKYIGITCQKVENRWAKGEGYKNQLFYRAIKKYGWDNFEHEIIESNLTSEQAKEKERELISLYDSTNPEKGYNVGLGGEGMFGGLFSEASKSKMSNSHKGKKMTDKTREAIKKANKGNKYCLGHKLSNSTKLKIGKASKGNTYVSGHIYTEQHKKKISEACKGRKHTEEARIKISNSHKGNKNYNARKIICLNTMQIFDTIIDCANAYNINKCTLGNWLRGSRRCKDEYDFMYYDEYLKSEKENVL